jgi:hypothetical protein
MSAGFDSVLELLLQHWLAVLVIGAGVAVPLCAVFTKMIQQSLETWRQSRQDQNFAALKQSMIERGMSADEIERVLRAGPQA